MKDLKVILVNPPWVEGAVRAGSRWPAIYPKDMLVQYVPFPFYLAYTAALLEPICEIYVFGCLAMRMSHKRFLRKCERIQPDLVIAETSSMSFSNDVEVCKLIKQACDSEILLSGPHATIYHKEILKRYAFIDYIALGEYEFPTYDLVRKLRGERVRLRAIAHRRGKKLISLPPFLIKDLDALPFPAWHLFPMNCYNENFCQKYPNFQLLSSRGCLFKCIFCLYPQVMEFGTFRYHSPGRTLEELRHVMATYKLREIYFDDSTFTQNRQRVDLLCDLILQEGMNIEWSCMTHVQTLDRELVQKMAGCTGIKFGIECGDQQIVWKIRKGLNLQHAKRVIRWCKEAGIRTHATFMFGLLWETKQTIRKTIRYAFELDADSAQFSIATHYPGTQFFELAQEEGWLIERDFSLYDGNNRAVISYPDLKAKELGKVLRWAQRRWFLHNLLKPKEVHRLLSLAYRQGGLKRFFYLARRCVKAVCGWS